MGPWGCRCYKTAEIFEQNEWPYNNDKDFEENEQIYIEKIRLIEHGKDKLCMLHFIVFLRTQKYQNNLRTQSVSFFC